MPGMPSIDNRGDLFERPGSFVDGPPLQGCEPGPFRGVPLDFPFRVVGRAFDDAANRVLPPLRLAFWTALLEDVEGICFCGIVVLPGAVPFSFSSRATPTCADRRAAPAASVGALLPFPARQVP